MFSVSYIAPSMNRNSNYSYCQQCSRDGICTMRGAFLLCNYFFSILYFELWIFSHLLKVTVIFKTENLNQLLMILYHVQHHLWKEMTEWHQKQDYSCSLRYTNFDCVAGWPGIKFLLNSCKMKKVKSCVTLFFLMGVACKHHNICNCIYMFSSNSRKSEVCQVAVVNIKQ